MHMNTKTLAYILKRIGLAILTVWVVITVTFFVMHAVPGGPFLSEKSPSPAVQAALEAKYGLDKPLFEQYTTYLKDILHLDFGPSIKQRGQQVTTIIMDGMKVSVKLGVIAAGCALACGVVLGAVAALRRNKIIDRIIMVVTTAFVSMPSFIMGSLLLVVFVVKLQLLPGNGSAQSGPAGLVLPIITLALYPMAYITRLTRSSMLDVLGQDYIRTARAKGADERRVVFRHVLRNGMLPVVTQVGISFASCMGGSVITETVFSIPGIGSLLINAVKGRDVPVVMGTLIFIAVFVGVINLTVDIIYALIDPRVKLAA